MRVQLVRFVLTVALSAPASLLAQDARLDRFDPDVRGAIQAIVDSAGRDGLPSEPLIQRALEGASKGAQNERIVAAVSGLAHRLGTARDVLGARADEAELVAAADALYLGIAPATLEGLKSARPKQPVTVPLLVLADLSQRGVPGDTLVRIVVELTQAGAGDASFTELRRLVEQDIRSGAPPGVAAATRAEGILLRLPPHPPPSR
jgi:hypothetical protein